MSMDSANMTELQEFNLTLTESLVFSSLISAVDPVAVLGELMMSISAYQLNDI